MNEISKELLKELLFEFLESIYVFEKNEKELFSLSWQEIYLLKKLIRNDKKTITEVSQFMRIPLFKTSRILKRLEKKNLIKKTKDVHDLRIIHITITEIGVKKVNKIEDYNCNTIINNLHNINTEEIDSLINAIGKLKKLLGINER